MTTSAPIQYTILKATKENIHKVLPDVEQTMSSFPFDAFADAKAACIHAARSWRNEADLVGLDYHQPTSGMFSSRVGWGSRATLIPVYFISYVYEKNNHVFTVTFTTQPVQEA